MLTEIVSRGSLRSPVALILWMLLMSQLFLMPCSGSDKFQSDKQILSINPDPQFEMSPYLYMQFMEPLGTTDASLAAAWDFNENKWREDVIEITRELAPTMIRWGGAFIQYYHWWDGVGPRDQRKPMVNREWGGIITNQIGTAEFIDFTRQVGAEPLICVNFESDDGVDSWATTKSDDAHIAAAKEAAAWVDYCNNPLNKERIKHDFKEPFNIQYWQIGNETSYGNNESPEFIKVAARRTIVFAKEMRKVDPTIKIIGWGDSGWAKQMIEIAGDHIDFVAFHHMFTPGKELQDSPLRGIEYRKNPQKTWDCLMDAYKIHEKRILEVEKEVAAYDVPLAMTECHFDLPGRNRCEVLSTWACGVSYARHLNLHERHSDKLKIATLADFCGTVWQVNAVMIPQPEGDSFMMPVAMVMSLYRNHTGEKALNIDSAPDALDVTASRTGNRLFLHVVNTNRTQPITSQLKINGMEIKSGRVFYIALDPEYEVFEYDPGHTSPKESDLPKNLEWAFPAASVSAVELDIIQ